jgi:hypothetical protein
LRLRRVAASTWAGRGGYDNRRQVALDGDGQALGDQAISVHGASEQHVRAFGHQQVGYGMESGHFSQFLARGLRFERFPVQPQFNAEDRVLACGGDVGQQETACRGGLPRNRGMHDDRGGDVLLGPLSVQLPQNQDGHQCHQRQQYDQKGRHDYGQWVE